jgi:EmrB/QacA subfamily drug resistance transporter
MARGWKILLVTSVAVYLVALDVTVVNIAFRAIEADLGASRATLSWVLSGYNIAFAAALLTAGRLADLFGRRRVFFLGLAVFSTASALCGLAPSAGALIAARVLQAVGGALVLPSSLALVLPEFPVERRSAAIGVWGAVGGVAAATGPSLGSLLVDQVDWRAVFFINTPLCLAAWWFGRGLLVESRDPGATRLPDVAGAVIGVGAVGLLTLAIVQGDQWGYGDAKVVAALVGAAVLLPLFVLRCARVPVPVLDLTLLRERFFSVANTAALLFSVGFFAMIFVNTQFLIGVWGYSVLKAGVAFTPGPLCAAVFAGPAGRMADLRGHRLVVVPGTVLFALGIGLLVVGADARADYWSVFFPSSLLVGLGVGLTIATIGSAANAYLPPTRFGMGTAFNATCRQVGAALGIAVVVSILDEPSPAEVGGSFDRAWVFIAATVLASGAVMLALYRRPSTVPVPAPAVADHHDHSSTSITMAEPSGGRSSYGR